MTEVFLDPGDHAALALGRVFFRDVLFDLAQGPLGQVQASGSREVGFWPLRFTVDYQVSLDPASLSVELLSGRVRVQVDGAGSLSPGGSFSLRLTQHFGLEVADGRLQLTLEQETEVDLSGGWVLELVLLFVRGRVEDAIRDAAAVVIAAANGELNRVVDDSVRGMLAELDLPEVELAFTRGSIDPDGILLGARLDLGPAPQVVAAFTDQITRPAGAPGGFPAVVKQVSALASWIPGGTIERYLWREVTAGGQVVDEIEERHRFVTRLLPELDAVSDGASFALTSAAGWPAARWCLEVHGRQLTGSGSASVSGSNCGLTVAVPSLDLRSGERLTLLVPDGSGGVLADVDPWGAFRPRAFAADREERGTLLVHRCGDEQEVATLHAVLAERDAKLPLVLPALVVDDAGRAAAYLGKWPELACTLDPEGAWRRRFGLERPGASVLVGPGGRELWRDEGPLKAAALEAALPGAGKRPPRMPRRRRVQLHVATGRVVPDVPFPCGRDSVVAMRKLRGREFQLAFWTSWSEASLAELARLAAAPRDPRKDPVLLVRERRRAGRARRARSARARPRPEARRRSRPRALAPLRRDLLADGGEGRPARPRGRRALRSRGRGDPGEGRARPMTHHGRLGFHLRGRYVSGYTVMLYAGHLLALAVVDRVARHQGQSPARAVAVLALAVPFALAGARALAVALRWSYYRARPREIARTDLGGAALYGALPPALLVTLPLTSWFGLSYGAFWDAAAVGILAGMIPTRLGCLASGCCAGRPTRSRLGLALRNETGRRARRVPAPLLEIALAGLLLVALLLVRERLPFPGAGFLLALCGYAAGRLPLEGLRERRGPLVAGATRLQWISLGLAGGGAALLAVGWSAAAAPGPLLAPQAAAGVSHLLATGLLLAPVLFLFRFLGCLSAPKPMELPNQILRVGALIPAEAPPDGYVATAAITDQISGVEVEGSPFELPVTAVGGVNVLLEDSFEVPVGLLTVVCTVSHPSLAPRTGICSGELDAPGLSVLFSVEADTPPGELAANQCFEVVEIPTP